MTKFVDYLRLAYRAADATEATEAATDVNNLKQLIKDAGLTNPSLAKKIGCKPVEIWRLVTWPEKGGRKMTPEWAIKIAPYIGVKPYELVFGKDTTDKDLQIDALKQENEKLKRIIKDLLD